MMWQLINKKIGNSKKSNQDTWLQSKEEKVTSEDGRGIKFLFFR
jgi:hypothetical protein